MSIRRIGVLLGKEFIYGSKSYFFIFAVVAPLVATLFVKLLFGSIFSDNPKVGITDQGHSQVVESLKHMKSINLQMYSTEIELRNAVEAGAQDLGIVIPKNFDSMIRKGESTKITAYVWGESLLKHRAIIGAAFLYRIREVSGKRAPVGITPVSLGDEDSIPWEERLLPSIILVAIFISGFAVPSTSLVQEKEKRTIEAVITTPVTQTELLVSKGLMGIIVSIAMGALTLILNHGFNAQLGLIVLLLFFGAVMACCFGLILGAFMKDVSSVYSAIEGLNIFIYAPCIVYLFPTVPQWIGKLFPTYYVMNPIMEVALKGGSWSMVNHNVFILIGIIAVLFTIVAIIANKTRQQEA